MSSGHIVNTASMGGLITNAYSGPYYTSKFAAVGFSECLAHDLVTTGAPIGVSVLVPSLVSTGIATSHRNRPERWVDRDHELGADEEFVLAALHDSTTGAGMPPADVAAMVFDAVEADRFWIPTKDSYHDQIRGRHEDMQALRRPASPRHRLDAVTVSRSPSPVRNSGGRESALADAGCLRVTWSSVSSGDESVAVEGEGDDRQAAAVTRVSDHAARSRPVVAANTTADEGEEADCEAARRCRVTAGPAARCRSTTRAAPSRPAPISNPPR